MPSLDGAFIESLLGQPGLRGARVGRGSRPLATVPQEGQVVCRGSQGQLHGDLRKTPRSRDSYWGSPFCAHLCFSTTYVHVVLTRSSGAVGGN